MKAAVEAALASRDFSGVLAVLTLTGTLAVSLLLLKVLAGITEAVLVLAALPSDKFPMDGAGLYVGGAILLLGSIFWAYVTYRLVKFMWPKKRPEPAGVA